MDEASIKGNNRVEKRLDELLSSFLISATGLFQQNQRYIREFEGGLYACAYLTPSQRLRLTMAVDREVLVVASTFSDQQQRTVKFIQSEIVDSSGRLEPTVAMAVHLDPGGNSKLRNWGRDLGISILPVDGRSGFGEARDIERKLAQQLFSHDPFDVTGPVSGDNNFFGRREEAIDLARKLQLGQIRACLGIRKVGKTSVISRVLKEIPKIFECATVMIDCSKDEVFELTAQDLLFSISRTVEKLQASEENYSNIDCQSGGGNLSGAGKRLEDSIFASSRTVLIVFDEVDYITPGSPTAEHWTQDFNKFWRNLRAVYQECERRGSSFSLLLGGVSTHWFAVGEIEGVENAALAFIPEEFLSPMPKGATVAMLRRLGKVSGISFSEEAADWIANETGNMPYWARKCCSYIHRQIPISDRPLSLGLSDVEPFVEQFVQNEGCQIAEVAIGHLFRVHPKMKDASRSILANSPGDVSDTTRRTLRNYGVTNSQDVFSGSMFARAVEAVLEASENNTQEDSSVLNVKNDFLTEWSEDLAALGTRRNVLERKLRNIALNFLRMDAMQSKSLDGISEKIISSLHSGRRKQLTGFQLDVLFQKLMWSELILILSKNWTVFEAIFGDKTAMEKNADLINDRPDAHAKEWDKADFALYRRALTWFEERVAKLQ